MKSMRWTTLAALLMSGLFAGCSTVPESGRRQLMLVSADQERSMGIEAFSQIKQEEKVSTNVMANDQVRRVGERIARSVGREMPEAKWEFVVFESDDINAFALPGGKVGVYTGLLNLVDSDDELAAVVGHEIAHVSSRHSAERMSQQMVALGVNLGSEVAMEAGEVDEGKRNIARAALGVGTTVGFLLPYSRLHETEADAIGLRFAAGAGYDPRAAAAFWRKMQKANEGQARPPEWLSTHPSSDSRIRNLEALAPEFMPLYREARARIESGDPDAIGSAPEAADVPLAEREIGG